MHQIDVNLNNSIGKEDSDEILDYYASALAHLGYVGDVGKTFYYTK